MSKTNGHGESQLDRIGKELDRLEASHVGRMTEHELFVKEHEKRYLVSGFGEFILRNKP